MSIERMIPATNLSQTRRHYEGLAYQATPRISSFDLRVRAGQLLNEAGDDRGELAQLRWEAASFLAEAAHHLDKIARLSRARDADVIREGVNG